jgi:hypothetical protein
MLEVPMTSLPASIDKAGALQIGHQFTDFTRHLGESISRGVAARNDPTNIIAGSSAQV